MKKFLVVILSIFVFAGMSFASGGITYDKYRNKTGSYKTNTNRTTTHYNRYGRKVGTYK